MKKKAIYRRLRRLKSKLKFVVYYNLMQRHKIKKEINQLHALLQERI